MNDYDVQIPMTIYAGTYVRNVHAKSEEQAIEKAVERLYHEGYDMADCWSNDEEVHEEAAWARLIHENIQVKPNIEE